MIHQYMWFWFIVLRWLYLLNVDCTSWWSSRSPPQRLHIQPKVDTLNTRQSLYQRLYSTYTRRQTQLKESQIILWALRFERVGEIEREWKRERESWDLHSSHECTRFTGISARTCCGNWWKMSSMKIYTR